MIKTNYYFDIVIFSVISEVFSFSHRFLLSQLLLLLSVLILSTYIEYKSFVQSFSVLPSVQ